MINKYIECKFDIKREFEDEFTEDLYALGISGFEVIDSEDLKKYLENKPEWELTDLEYEYKDTIQIKAYVEDDERARNKVSELELLADKYKSSISIQNIENDWSSEWKKHYEPIEIGEKLLIVPAWLDSDSERLQIKINPGLAFGTGYHETTKLILEEIMGLDLKGKTCLDLGCGSGILSILMSKLGAKKVEACDIDEDALLATRENIDLNSIDNIDVFYSDLFSEVRGTYDFISANIIAEILVRLIDDLPRFLSKDGLILFSGIIREREKLIVEKLKDKYEIVSRRYDGDWVMIGAKFK